MSSAAVVIGALRVTFQRIYQQLREQQTQTRRAALRLPAMKLLGILTCLRYLIPCTWFCSNSSDT